MPSPASMHELDDSAVHYEWNNGIEPRLEIEPGDTVESLSRRILEEEHRAYPEAIARVLERLPAAP